ncbi:MAG TPA: YihY/virulence factor BrkB family protein [Gaiellales bacterium]|nr:YihY/virulence factor BrkB family protein [Gaiellales bacterium]
MAAANRYFADRCPQHAAGIAYRVLFSSVPLAVVLVSVFGVMLGNAEVRDAVVTAIVNALPAEAADRADVAGAISSITPPPGLLGLLTLAVFVWSATGMMAAIRAGLEVATHAQHGRPVVRGKLIDLLLVVGAALLVLTTVALTALDRLTQHALHRIETATGIDAPLSGTLLPRLATAAVWVGVVLLLYRLVPTRRMSRSDALAGAVITAILFLGISLASGLVYRSATHLSVVYGSLTGVFVFLYAVYLYASALLFGAEVASAWSAPAQPVSEPLGVQLRRAVRGLFTSTDARQPDEAAAPAPTRE